MSFLKTCLSLTIFVLSMIPIVAPAQQTSSHELEKKVIRIAAPNKPFKFQNTVPTSNWNQAQKNCLDEQLKAYNKAFQNFDFEKIGDKYGSPKLELVLWDNSGNSEGDQDLVNVAQFRPTWPKFRHVIEAYLDSKGRCSVIETAKLLTHLEKSLKVLKSEKFQKNWNAYMESFNLLNEETLLIKNQ